MPDIKLPCDICKTGVVTWDEQDQETNAALELSGWGLGAWCDACAKRQVEIAEREWDEALAEQEDEGE